MIPTTTIENPNSTLTALNRATKMATDSATPRSAKRARVRNDNLQAFRRGDGWRTASTISSNQRKLIIVTTALQVNPTIAVVTMINFLWLEEIVEAVLQPSPRS